MLGEIRRRVAQGHREIVLTGVDITSYGANLPGRIHVPSIAEPSRCTTAGAWHAAVRTHAAMKKRTIWRAGLVMLAAFAAMFSTVYSVMDGFPRAFSRLVRTLRPDLALLRVADPERASEGGPDGAFVIGRTSASRPGSTASEKRARSSMVEYIAPAANQFSG